MESLEYELCYVCLGLAHQLDLLIKCQQEVEQIET